MNAKIDITKNRVYTKGFCEGLKRGKIDGFCEGLKRGKIDEREKIRRMITNMVHGHCMRDDDDCLWNEALIELRAKLSSSSKISDADSGDRLECAEPKGHFDTSGKLKLERIEWIKHGVHGMPQTEEGGRK